MSDDNLSKKPEIVFRLHALKRMFERRISRDELITVIENGTIIEDYPDDFPLPSRLLLGWVGRRPVHVVIADNAADNEIIVVTAYEPDPQRWRSGFTQRIER